MMWAKMTVRIEGCPDATVHVTGVIDPYLLVSIYLVCKEVDACMSYDSSSAPLVRVIVDGEERARYLPKDLVGRVRDAIISCFGGSNEC